jgi:hypothetical protein
MAALGGLLLLWSESYPGGGFFGLLFGFWLVAACVATWLLRLTTYLARRNEGSERGPWWPFLVEPVGAVVVIALLAAGAPFALRWGLSREAFDARADQMAARAEDAGDGRTHRYLDDDRVALYEVRDGWIDPQGNVFFAIAGSGFIDSTGFARIGGDVPQRYASYEFEHLEGDWYTYVQPF